MKASLTMTANICHVVPGFHVRGKREEMQKLCSMNWRYQLFSQCTPDQALKAFQSFEDTESLVILD